MAKTQFRTGQIGTNGDAWVAWTPALTATGGNPALGTGGTITGKYLQVGKFVTADILIKAGTASTTTGTGTYQITLPVAAKNDSFIANNADYIIGSGICYQAASGLHNYFLPYLASSTLLQCYGLTNTGSGTAVTMLGPWASGTFQLAVNNQISLRICYEAA